MGVYQTISSSFMIQLRARFSYVPVWLWLLQIVLTSFFSMFFFAVLADYAHNPEISMQYVVLGNAVQSIASSTLYATSIIPGTEKHTGTLPMLVSAPPRLFTIMLGMGMFNLLSGLVAAVFGLCASALVFGVDFSSCDILSIIVTMILTILSLSGLGMFIGGIGIRLRSSAVIANLISYIGWILCGVNFPVSSLPEWLQVVSYCHPLTYAVEATRKSVEGFSVMEISHELGMMILIGLISFVLSYILFTMFEHMARTSGALDKF